MSSKPLVFKQFDINVAHKPTRSIKNEVCKLKDKRENSDKAGIVYGLNCMSCPSVYVGETGRQTRDRMKEHQFDIVKKKAMSKVYKHTAETGHSFNFDDVKILDDTSNVRVRRQLESTHTHLQTNSIN